MVDVIADAVCYNTGLGGTSIPFAETTGTVFGFPCSRFDPPCYRGISDPWFKFSRLPECSSALLAMIPGSTFNPTPPQLKIPDRETIDDGTNVLDGFVFTVADFDVDEQFCFDWYMLDETGGKICELLTGTLFGDEFGCGSFCITRKGNDCGEAVFNLQSGATQDSDVTLFATVPLGVPGQGEQFCAEPGAGVSAPRADPNLQISSFGGMLLRTDPNLVCRVGACCVNGDCGADGDAISPEACAGFGGLYYGDGTACIAGLCGMPPLTGACCLKGVLCKDAQTEAQCEMVDAGSYQDDGSSCAAVTCPPAQGACCLPNGDCEDGRPQLSCQVDLGRYLGDGSLCASQVCPAGPCCLTGGICSPNVPAGDCIMNQGRPGTPGDTCAGAACPITGACCLSDGGCLDNVSSTECTSLLPGVTLRGTGTYQGDGSTCATVTCPPGACCRFQQGTCDDAVFPENCTAPDTYQGDGTICAAADCPGACCLSDGTCADDLTAADCAQVGGSFQGQGSTCAVGLCPGACCLQGPATIFRDLVLTLDVSGSINDTELQLEIDGLKTCLADEIPQDGSHSVAIVVYGSEAALALGTLTPVNAGNLATIINPVLDNLLIDRIVGTGSTNIGQGLMNALAILEGASSTTSNDTIVLVGDGASNIGPNVQAECDAIAAANIAICSIAVGASQAGEEQLEDCANSSNGNFGLAPTFSDFLQVCRDCFAFVTGSTCTEVPLAECMGLGGVFQGDGTDCVPDPCLEVGACCLPDGTCQEDITETTCDNAGGIYQGSGVTCASSSCCGNDQIDPGEQCDGTDAPRCPGECLSDCTCPVTGACCVDEGTVIEREIVLCLDVSGSISGAELSQEIDGLKTCLTNEIPGDGSYAVAIVVYGATAADALPTLTPVNAANLANVINPVLDNLLNDRIVSTGSTNIGQGLINARSILSGAGSTTDNNFILLVGDGSATIGPAVAQECDNTSAENITVCSIAVGASLSGQIELEACAQATGGQFGNAVTFQDFQPVCEECFQFVESILCSEESQANCTTIGGMYQGDNTVCPASCVVTGACDVSVGSSVDREIVMTLDVSGSISDIELQQEIDGLKACLANEVPQDGTQRVAIVVYGATAAAALSTLTPVTPTSRANIINPVLDGIVNNRIVGTGSTNIGEGLALSRAILKGVDSTTDSDYVLLVGDGEATTGPPVVQECASTASAGIVICSIAVAANQVGQDELEGCAVATGGQFGNALTFADFQPVCEDCFEFVTNIFCDIVSAFECDILGGDYLGDGTSCPTIRVPDPIPTTSQWGIVVMVMLTLIAGSVIFKRRRFPSLGRIQ